MSAHPPKPTLPDVLPRVRAYRGDSLHVVLDDQNVSDMDVAFCRDYAAERGDAEGVALAETLLAMSRSQRLRLCRLRHREVMVRYLEENA